MKKILMCPPTHFDIEYEINPWMHLNIQVNPQEASRQWQKLYDSYRSLGVEIELIEQKEGLPDMVFTANAGMVYGKIFISGNYRYKERKGEEPLFQQWFEDHGYTVKTLSHFQGGEGDALMYKGTLYMGYGFRSYLEAHREIASLLNIPVVSVRLIDPNFYDFDTTFCPLGDRGFLYYPLAYVEEDREKMSQVKGAIAISTAHANNFVGNSVYSNGKLLVEYLDDDLRAILSRLDIEPVLFNMSEFKKSGGGIKCLTLYIE